MARNPLLTQVLIDYVDEADALLAQASRCLLALERGGEPPGPLHDELSRALHTLKGTCGTLQLPELASLAHGLEEYLEPSKQAGAQLPHEVADLVLRAFDAFGREVRVQASSERPVNPEVERLIAHVTALCAGQTPPPAVEAGPSEPVDDEARALSWRVTENSMRSLQRDIEGLRELRLRLASHRAELESAAAEVPSLGGRLRKVGRSLEGDAADAGGLVESLEAEVRSICTVAMGVVLEPLQRLVRDLCRSLGKEARLSTISGGISIDRVIVEALRGPLVHLVRNAVDHGLEAPDQRKAAGKHVEGALVVRVEQQGNWLFIEVSDDGRGLEVEPIRRAAEARGLEPKATLDAMSERDVMQLIFRPGLSTRAEATEVSGRGVGLDVVMKQVRELGGSVEVHSTPGRGARFLLAIPTELGASSLLVVRCGDARVGLPSHVVERALYLEEGALRRTPGGARLEHAGALIPLLDLGALLGLHAPLLSLEDVTVLILSHRGERAAVAVDEVLGDWELVTRPLPVELRGLGAFQGAAALAHGEQLVVLRPEWLFDPRQEAGSAPAAHTERRVLVVDDSVGARMMHRTILEAGGFTVNVVASATSAQRLLRTARYDAIVCDVMMEGMDGVAFTDWVRTQDRLRAVPVLLVSAQSDAASRQRGLERGAAAFLSKQDCASGKLLAELTTVLAQRAR
ncbi:MAG: response regulator [Archangium sp.]|nr:response regulator [Archangium sp.]